MNSSQINGWQDVRDEVLRRIHARTWKPGDLIPNETDLAIEFGCARATVNRALRALADNGTLDRRRKAGTRVALKPVARATLAIPLIRQEIESRGAIYGYRLMEIRKVCPPAPVLAAMQASGGTIMLHLSALHLADRRPHALEERWINLETVPDASTAPFETISANEWLVANAPYTSGDITFSAEPANRIEAETLGCHAGDALFVMHRLTWDGDAAVTRLRLAHAPGYNMRTQL